MLYFISVMLFLSLINFYFLSEVCLLRMQLKASMQEASWAAHT